MRPGINPPAGEQRQPVAAAAVPAASRLNRISRADYVRR